MTSGYSVIFKKNPDRSMGERAIFSTTTGLHYKYISVYVSAKDYFTEGYSEKFTAWLKILTTRLASPDKGMISVHIDFSGDHT